MPELPEVETIRRQLEKYLAGHKVTKVEVRWRKSLSENENKLVEGYVKKIRRFGKVLSIDLDNGYSAVIHIKLTGQLIYLGPNLKKQPRLSKKIVGGVPGKHTHVIFYLDRKGLLYYNDVRKFGWIKIIKSSELKVKNDFIARLGPEPVVDEKNPPDNPLTLENFKEIVGSTKRVIKVLLMDQEKIGGVGNIYANDALWLARILPTRSAKSLSPKERSKLYDAILNVLKEGLKRGGASELSYVTPDGNEGSYQEHFLAYGKKDELCTRCRKGKFKKINLGGRGTYFCPVCQV
ncbi:DNA-formamidopyrimidine glycosylase [Candidatus Woesebacteria bacterium RBG_16_39_8b]|uniref:DNA-formamidopyrimidine glycosylase n=1 Tax=Candidatus Woesebacteria bacterium RBG_16_39_8b TaxID=1802482 RepID=A0A1F7XDX6_9BACT|nr:MAG: DNA-formamidopyrimidine glycosylase [Candidatus Woesebacteria bacterium RBG_16_39_8b]